LLFQPHLCCCFVLRLLPVLLTLRLSIHEGYCVYVIGFNVAGFVHSLLFAISCSKPFAPLSIHAWLMTFFHGLSPIDLLHSLSANLPSFAMHSL
jgi:hypothetical protein